MREKARASIFLTSGTVIPSRSATCPGLAGVPATRPMRSSMTRRSTSGSRRTTPDSLERSALSAATSGSASRLRPASERPPRRSLLLGLSVIAVASCYMGRMPAAADLRASPAAPLRGALLDEGGDALHGIVGLQMQAEHRGQVRQRLVAVHLRRSRIGLLAQGQ